MSAKFEIVQYYYERHFWTAAMVHNAVIKGWITAEEYMLITGKPF